MRSVLTNVRCKDVEAEDSILINVTANKIVAPRGCILYNVVDSSEEGIVLVENEVRVGVFSDDESQLVVRSSTTIDGGKSWENKVLSNAHSFEEIYNANANADPTMLESVISKAHDAAWQFLSRSKSSKRVNSQVEYSS